MNSDFVDHFYVIHGLYIEAMYDFVVHVYVIHGLYIEVMYDCVVHVYLIHGLYIEAMYDCVVHVYVIHGLYIELCRNLWSMSTSYMVGLLNNLIDVNTSMSMCRAQNP